jgi:uncharacterized protein YkwD
MATKIAAVIIYLLALTAASQAKRDLLAILPDSKANIAQILVDHNNYRKKHGAAPLKWSSTLAKGASKWANNCKYEHNPPPNTGENLAVFLVRKYYNRPLHLPALLTFELNIKRTLFQYN